MNNLKQCLQPRDVATCLLLVCVMVVAVVTGCVEYSELGTKPTKTYLWEAQVLRIDSCEYIVGKGADGWGVYAITHKANCDNHGSKP